MLVYEDHVTGDHKSVVYALAFSPDGMTLASGARDGGLRLRDGYDDGVSLIEPGPKTPAVHAVAFLPDGRLVVGHAHGWHLYRRDDGSWRMLTPPSSTPTTAVAALGPDLLAVGTGERLKPTGGAFEVWDIKAERRKEPVFREPNGVRAVAACPAKSLVAWATGHKKVTVWDIRKQTPLHFPTTHINPAVALAPDGTTLAAATDWTTRLFDLGRRQERAVLKGHKGMVSAVAFSPNGRTVWTGSWDQTVRRWDAATGVEEANFAWPVGKIYSLAVAPDGSRVAAGGDQGAVVVWDAE